MRSPGDASRSGATLAGLLLLGLLVGCVSVPTSGPVEQVDPLGAGEDFLVQITPSGPAAGATRVEVVRGFLTAMQAFPVSTEVAREFLTEEAAAGWRPARRTVVYASASVAEPSRDGVDLRTRAVAELSERGTYRPAEQDGDETVRRLTLERTDTGWRIADPPDQLLLSAGFFEAYFRPYDLYFLDPGGSALVADPVWLPQGEQVSTRLVQGLLAGPTSWLRGAAVTAVTSEADVDVSVPLRSDGVADVQLSGVATSLSDMQRELLSAQLVWTLWQVTGVEGVRLSVDGAELDVPGAETVQTTSAWQDYAPSGPDSRSQLFGLRRNRLLAVGPDSVARLTGWWGSGRERLGEFSVERFFALVAATDGDRERLLVGPYDAESRSQVRTRYAGEGVLEDPQFDRTGQLWVLDDAGPASTLVVVEGRRSRAVPTGRLPAAGIRGFDVSPDGVRVAALVDRWRGPWWGGARPSRDGGPALVVARVVRASDGTTVRRLDRAYGVSLAGSGLRDPAAPVWGAPSEVSVLGRVADVPPQEYRIAIDGSTVEGAALTGEPLLGPVGADDLAATGVAGTETVIGDSRGRLWTLDAQSEWTRLGDVTGVLHPRHPE